MGIYMFTLIVTYVLAKLSIRYGSGDMNNPDAIKPNKLFVYLLILTFVMISGLRYMNYYESDEWNYRQIYLYIADNIDFRALFSEKEWGFSLLNWILSRLSSDPQIMIFTAAVITNTLVVLTAAEFARPFELAIFLYAAYIGFFSSFNIMRQCLAMAIIFWGIRYVLQRRFWHYLMLVAVAATIHTSSWTVLPAYFLVGQKSLKWFLPLFIAALLIMANFQSAANFFLADTTYENYLKGIEAGASGVNPIRILSYCIPLGIMLLFKKQLVENNSNNIIFINYSIISCLIMLISLNYIYVARLDTFFGIVGILSIPQLTKIFINDSKNRVLYNLLILFYFIFGLYQAVAVLPEYHNVLLEDMGGRFL